MSRSLGATLPAAVRTALEADLELSQGLTFLLLTVREDGWPHQAMLSAGELVVRGEAELRLALWPTSTTTRNLTDAGRGTLTCVLDEVSYMLRLATQRLDDLETPLAGRLAAFHARVEEASADEAPYAVLESGVRHRLKDSPSVLARWAEARDALRAL